MRVLLKLYCTTVKIMCNFNAAVRLLIVAAALPLCLLPLSHAIALYCHLTCMAILFVCVCVCVCVYRVVVLGERMFSQIPSMCAGVHGPLFVAANVDHSGCVHMALGALQR